MIQRIQTLYLVLGAVSIGSIYLLSDIWTGPTALKSHWLMAVTLGISGICVVGAFVAVFLYKDRKRQRSVVLLLQVFTILGLLTLFTGEYFGGLLPFVGTNSDGMVEGIGLGFAAGGYLFFYLARRAIDKDIELTKSVDRLR
ncbi:MAG: DUF4293 family protein [Rhodothermia bacterium]|nr:MAG: DUF4293 family protein [Rhodothermia bacterium]